MRVPALEGIRDWLGAPAARRRPLFLDLGRLGVFLFGLLAVTGALLSLGFEPSASGAHDSLVALDHDVRFGWVVRSLHRVAGHALVVVTGIYLLRGFFRRLFLGPRGAAAWMLAAGLALVSLAFLVTGVSLPWNQEAYWSTVVNAAMFAEIPLVGGWLSAVFRGGPAVTGLTLVRLYAIHVVILPWIAFGLLVLTRELRRKGGPS